MKGIARSIDMTYTHLFRNAVRQQLLTVIPRCASNSLRAAARGMGVVPLEKAPFYLHGGYTLVAMLRNPFERMASAYRFLISRDPLRGYYKPDSWADWVFTQAGLPDSQRDVHARSQFSALHLNGLPLLPRKLVPWDFHLYRSLTGLQLVRKNASVFTPVYWDPILKQVFIKGYKNDLSLWETANGR